MNGHTISFTSNASLSNNGTLDIYNTASTPGKISGSYQQVLVNSGTLTLNGTSTSKKIIIEKTSLNNTAGAVYNASSGRVILSNGAYLFSYLSNLNTINSLQNVDFTYVNSTVEMFAYCTSLNTLDLRNVNTYSVRYMDRMFYGCSNLRTIYANSSFTTTQVTSSISMFENCYNIRGGMGTTYMTSPTDKTFAKIDGNAGIGYFTQG